MAVTFGAITLSQASKVSMQQDNFSMTCTFDCVTSSYTEIQNLKALTGPATPQQLLSSYVLVVVRPGSSQKQTLTINGTAYTNCVISEPIQITELLNLVAWKYTIKFVQSTAG
jgi:hypothetical protein